MKRTALLLSLLALAACGPGKTCEEAFRRTRVAIRLEDSTLRRLLDELETRTGFPIARGCSCGMLQEAMDRPGFTMKLNDISAMSALKLSWASLTPHCGGWGFERDRVVLCCGLVMPARPDEGWLKRTLSALSGAP